MPTAPTAPANIADTREQLLRTALFAFADHGVEGVRLSHVRDAAGQSNRSAVHYHFKNKETLVQAVVEFVQSKLAPHMQAALNALKGEHVQAGQLPTLVEVMFGPFVNLFASGAVGEACIRFMSRLTWQTGTEGQRVLTEFFIPYANAFAPCLQACLPQLSAAELRFKLYLAVNNSIHGLADFSILLHDPGIEALGEHEPAPLAMRRLFFDYIAGGLAGAGPVHRGCSTPAANKASTKAPKATR
ncbi:MAG TPA: TetR family transcriptional regulator [Limnobacter sp.]|nr:TetR family transcriptional regulator [Limnobacter sp.]